MAASLYLFMQKIENIYFNKTRADNIEKFLLLEEEGGGEGILTWDAELINMLYLSPFCIYIKIFLVVAFHAGVYWPLLGVWQIQSCYLAVGRMLKFSAPTLTQARYCIHTT